MEPSKHALCHDDTVLSKWLECVRKDVECFFGRLKGRFRILKLPILFREKKHVDNVFFTACILHNMLHSMDGLNKLEPGVKWTGVDGLHDSDIADPDTDVSSVGLRGDDDNGEAGEVEPTHDEFREKLMASFAYRKKHNDIKWLTTSNS